VLQFVLVQWLVLIEAAFILTNSLVAFPLTILFTELLPRFNYVKMKLLLTTETTACTLESLEAFKSDRQAKT
jgi:glucose-6-phosphate-specific signal transduction histidine kinase